MKRRFFTVAQVVALTVVGTLAGATAGKVIPSLQGMTSANAASLSVQPTAPLAPVGNGFTYQGQLIQSGNPATGQFDFQFTLWDDPSAGNQVGSTNTFTNTAVTNGLFTITLNFGATAFNGSARYLQIEVQPNGGGGYTTLLPRQALNPAPYSLFAMDVQPYDNVIVVSPSGGDFTTITAALNSITDNSSANKYLIWVGPGTYNERVTMKPFVDIEGAGEKVTKITRSGTSNPDTGTVVGASNAELRSLTVESVSAVAIAIYNSSASPSLLHVTAIASSSSGFNSYGVYNTSASPDLSNVTITASGGTTNHGIFNISSSSPDLSNVTITASGGTTSYGMFTTGSSSPEIINSSISGSGSQSYGVHSTGGGANTVRIDSSIIAGTTNSIHTGNGFSTKVGASRLNGGGVASVSGGTTTCANVYDEGYAAFTSTCP